MAAISILNHRMPVIDVTYPAEVEPADYSTAFERFAAISRAGRKVGYLIDMRQFNPLRAPPTYRKAAAEVFARHAATLKPVTVCEARVFTSTITRGVVTAFDWLTGTKWPCANFTSLEEAEAWVRAKLRAAGAMQ